MAIEFKCEPITEPITVELLDTNGKSLEHRSNQFLMGYGLFMSQP